MTTRPARSSTIWLGLSGLAAVASAFVLSTWTSQTGFEHRFDVAAAGGSAPIRVAKDAPRDGTEDYWLGRGSVLAITPVSFDSHLTVGTGLPKGLDKAGRDLEIVGIRRLEDDGRDQLLLVTCRDRGQGRDDRLVKMLIQVPARGAGQSPRAL